MEAHALTALLTEKRLRFPFIVLLLSGGHSLIAVVRGVDDFVLLGTGLDASPGAIIDKLSRRLHLPSLRISPDHDLSCVSGGRAMELIYQILKGNPRAYSLPLPRSVSRDCDFSFSGIHVAAERLIERIELDNLSRSDIHEGEEFVASAEERLMNTNSVLPRLNLSIVSDVCASIQYTISKHICRKTQRAIEFALSNGLLVRNSGAEFPCSDSSESAFKGSSLVVSGGVGANQLIRDNLERVAAHYKINFVAPPPSLCTDNGVMIAWNGVLLYQKGLRIISDIDSLDFETK
ncbi:unnamed protein product [Protopolystoma xenopodis]|uniref:N(6)-L-threonylcarbamoyladenine synthase n=1 Tax=Protopolystoma xenopodis TaxID=117903 RepID=A0A3S5AEM2_9PLAT|nr:unnamed protein product [Protopolystoma xenopodis]